MWCEEAQYSRILYIMLAFFAHFSEAKALSSIRAFSRKINIFSTGGI